MKIDDDSIWSEFANDAGEALAAIEGALLVLEDAPGRMDEINRLYRGLHTIKGNAGFLRLMGVERLAHVAALLTAHGRAPETPVAIIESGTLPGQRVTAGTLATIVQQASDAAVQSPATIVVGDVVALRSRLGLDTGAEPAWTLTRSA